MEESNKINSHKDLDLWEISLELAAQLYNVTRNFPKEEEFGLVSQIRRAGISVCSNISEGSARHNQKEFVQFLYISLASVTELEAQLVIAKRLGFIGSNETYTGILMRIKMMILGHINKCQN